MKFHIRYLAHTLIDEHFTQMGNYKSLWVFLKQSTIQFICSDTGQIWIWFMTSNIYFCKPNRRIDQQRPAASSMYLPLAFVNPTLQYIPRNMHTVFALLCFVVVIHWLIFPYPSSLLHWHCGNLTIAPVPAKQPWWIWITTSCEFIMNDCITTTKQSTTKPCAYFLGYTVGPLQAG